MPQYCEASPSKGAETLYAKCETLYERLPPEHREFIETAVGVWSNRGTAGGPAALDAALGARMNATGTRRIRDSNRRHDGARARSLLHRAGHPPPVRRRRV